MIPYLDMDDVPNRSRLGDNVVGMVASMVVTMPPYVSEVNSVKETIVVHNPSSFRTAQLGGHQLVVDEDRHVFHFPAAYALAPGAAVTVHCTPGLAMDSGAGLPEPKLLWHNQDGKLRTRPVLGTRPRNAAGAVVLFDGNGAEVAAWTPGEDSSQAGVVYLSAYERRRLNAVRRGHVFLCYIRLLLLCLAMSAGGSAAYGGLRGMLWWWAASLACDLIARAAHVACGGGPDGLEAALLTLGDRLQALLLYGTLLLHYRETKYFSVGLMMVLELASFWVEAQCPTDNYGGSMADGIFLMSIKHPLLVSLVSCGHHLHLALLLLGAEGTLPGWAVFNLAPLLTVLTICSAAKQLVHGVQLLVSLARLSAVVVTGQAWEMAANNKSFGGSTLVNGAED